MLRAGFGGLVLTVKSSETKRWQEYLERCGRSDDLVVFSPESDHRFNFLEYERTRTTRGGGTTENLVELFVTAMNAASGEKGAGTQDPYWDKALRQLLRNVIDALQLADEPLTIANMHKVIVSAPQSEEMARDLEWQAASYLFQVLCHGRERAVGDAQHDFEATASYWLEEFAQTMDPRTRGNIVSTFTTTADGFVRGDLRKLFTTDLTIGPEATLSGKVIVLDLPSKQFHDLGRIAQIVWKQCWQRAVEEADRDDDSRPVFLWADEAQNFITASEPSFVQTVREQRGCCVYITQAKANYLHALGAGLQAAVESFLGIPKTKIFHCNGDPETNKWAEQIISEDWRTKTSHTISGGEQRNGLTGSDKSKHSAGSSQERQARVHASEFGALSCGGPPDLTVQAILFQSGRQFDGGDGNFVRLSFRQSYSNHLGAKGASS